MMNVRERPSAEERRKFSRIWGVKTTIQHDIDIELRGVSSCGGKVWEGGREDGPTDAAQGFYVDVHA